MPISNEPISYFIDRFDDSDGAVRVDQAGTRDKLILSLGKGIVSGPINGYDSAIRGFESLPLAEKRAAVILRSLFEVLTGGEESLQATLLHATTAEERRKAISTKNEFEYVGSEAVGDSTVVDDNGLSQRMLAIGPLFMVQQHDVDAMANRESTVITNPHQQKWMSSVSFEADLNVIVSPQTRLGIAQTAYTVEKLLDTRAFGGAGLR